MSSGPDVVSNHVIRALPVRAVCSNEEILHHQDMWQRGSYPTPPQIVAFWALYKMVEGNQPLYPCRGNLLGLPCIISYHTHTARFWDE